MCVSIFFSHLFDFTLVLLYLCLCLGFCLRERVFVCFRMWQTKHAVEILFKINAFFPFSFLSHFVLFIRLFECSLVFFPTSTYSHPFAIFQIHIQFYHIHRERASERAREAHKHSQPQYVPLNTRTVPHPLPPTITTITTIIIPQTILAAN